MPVLNPGALLQNRVRAIRKFHEETGIKRAELDLSGGIDSAVMAGLLVLALGAENVTLAHLAINSNPVQTDRAVRLAQGIGCRLAVSDFTQEYQSIVSRILTDLVQAGFSGDEIEARLAADPTILGSIRSCLRAPLGRAFNRITGGGIRHGTGNECEDRFLRFYQKGGDGEVDTNPIAMLSKAEVYQLALELSYQFDGKAHQVYLDTIGAVPSADLWGCGDAHNDESEISKWLGAKFTYGRLDTCTGKVVNVGTIERVARFLDEAIAYPEPEGFILKSCVATWQEDALFASSIDDKMTATLLGVAVASQAFKDSGVDPDQILKLLIGARKAEKQTRHKLNPNTPQLGTRKELVQAGILTDDLTRY